MPPIDLTPTTNDPGAVTGDTVELHVKRVPRPIWQKARNNAMSSRTSFREFVIRTLENSQPLTSALDRTEPPRE